MKKIFFLFLIMVLSVILTGCGFFDGTGTLNTDNTISSVSTTNLSTNKEELESFKDYKIKTAIDVDPNYIYPGIKMFCDKDEIPIYNCKVNFSHTWTPTAQQRMNSGVAILELKGKAKFTIETDFNINDICTIRPLSEEVKFVCKERSVDFIIEHPGQYTIELSSSRTIHLFINEYEVYDSYKNQSNAMYFGPGIHNKSNDNRISSNNRIYLNSNTTVFIDEGAIVEAAFVADHKSDIKIVGYGIVSGANFERDASKGTVTVPYDFNYCNNIGFYGIATLDPAGWCYNLYFSKNIILDNIKIISSRSNGDGVSLQSCENATCTNSFVRTWDDSLVVKNYPEWSNRNNEGTTRHIRFEKCIIWTDLAQSMEIGYETVGSIMDDITFENITVLHNYHKAIISIHNGNNANVSNVTYRNIVVEDASMGKGDGTNVLFEFTCEHSSTWSDQHKITGLGSIDGVLIENCNILKSSNPLISIRGSKDVRNGYNSTHYCKNITFRNVIISGEKLDSTYSKLEMVYSSDILFE